MVSAIELSPISGFASSLENPGKNSASGFGASPTNHSLPVPESWIPKSVPFRVIATTMLLPIIFLAASRVTLQTGIERLRKKWSLPLIKSRTFDAVSALSIDLIIAGAIIR